MCTKGISEWRLVSCLLDTTSFISASICCKDFYFCHKCSSVLYMQIYLYLKRKCLCIKADQHKLPNQLLKLTNQGVDDTPKWMFFLENLKEREIDHWSFICFVVWLGANKIINLMNIAFKLNIFSCWFTLPTYVRGLSTIHPKMTKKVLPIVTLSLLLSSIGSASVKKANDIFASKKPSHTGYHFRIYLTTYPPSLITFIRSVDNLIEAQRS